MKSYVAVKIDQILVDPRTVREPEGFQYVVRAVCINPHTYKPFNRDVSIPVSKVVAAGEGHILVCRIFARDNKLTAR